MAATIEHLDPWIGGRADTVAGRAVYELVSPVDGKIASKIVDGFQSIISRESNLLVEPAVITVGKITAGVRFNIIPESAELIGTVRTLDPDMRELIIRRMTEMSKSLRRKRIY